MKTIGGRKLLPAFPALPPSMAVAGVTEIRVRAEGGAFRVLYVATFPDAVYVLHAFQKKAQKTAKADLSLATTRYKALRKEQ